MVTYTVINYTRKEYSTFQKGPGALLRCDAVCEILYAKGEWDEADAILIYRVVDMNDLKEIWETFEHVMVFFEGGPKTHCAPSECITMTICDTTPSPLDAYLDSSGKPKQSLEEVLADLTPLRA